ncbi:MULTISPECIES: sugar ABC transporter ATP-binding protein [unclassified Mesorhizobium]|uniref:sugar ABC transporter ATP-binding protein n=1 Tax=unclassified Mesorhizobium TaxID=325217 RepID=UPI00241590D7|nr:MULTISPECIES: sugar ABC transporter ATP-binding protein [unclassified Mesorhizobium]MDG4889972.1 sugar ABC transporter ATP-binding protein [Mesorhizobium sp. WSM4887]MDG4904114.1 sugar ABC transporter ATP-binding protein [Mesorhizobium sp. WSM4962]MDG4909141.1 sugar ABC transporter ATP-binding protein [Mesorhizobium sp. WSM4898]MDG4921765.1 sugar ABC transporter ATP-binding protein [Mesorhizobium sp. WSM4989]
MSELARLSMKGIRKSFGSAVAISEGDLSVMPGEVHALMGANGAGKSTMMNALGGIIPVDDGTIEIDGKAVALRHARDAASHGIAFVHQELTMLPTMTAAENVFIDRFPTRFGRIDRQTMRSRCKELLQLVGCSVSPDTPVETLSTGDRQMLEIARALKSNPRIVILDEPTSSLSRPERERLFDVVRKLKAMGTAVVYITHFLEEVFTICDAVTVMRNGRTVSATKIENTTPSTVLREMLGEIAATERLREPYRTSAPARLTVRNLTRERVLDDINLTLRPGEIVGLWGLLGSGRSELVRALMGLDPIDRGDLELTANGSSGRVEPEYLRKITGLVTEDRRGEGLILPFSVAENISLPQLKKMKSKSGLVDTDAEKTLAETLIKRLGVKVSSPQQPVGTLSGGNQQKVVFARWLPLKPELFILDEPTRGLDTGAKDEILKLSVELAKEGAAILFISSELEEIMRVADRYVVIIRGRITQELPGTATKDELMESISARPAVAHAQETVQ